MPGYDRAVTQRPRRGLLWRQLRESTRAAHAQAEASLAPLAQPDSLASYAVLLCVLWGFQAPMERLLGHQELPSAVGWPGRQRLGALAADLTDLGVTGVSLPEGATLGGRVLRRRIETRLGPVPARFLDGHGDRTQPMWRDLGQLAGPVRHWPERDTARSANRDPGLRRLQHLGRQRRQRVPSRTAITGEACPGWRLAGNLDGRGEGPYGPSLDLSRC